MLTDQIIFSTGFRTDWALRPEFSSFAPHIRVWRDRFNTPEKLEDEELSDSPDLGSCFEFQPKTPDACPGLDRIHCFNYAATLSHGACSGDIPQISDGAQRLAQGLAAKFMAEDIDHHFEALKNMTTQSYWETNGLQQISLKVIYELFKYRDNRLD